jgi:hypothetical protein
MKTLFSIALLVCSTLVFASYEDHFPVYFEYCTGTQWKLQSGDIGGTPGHGLTYIHGLCKDYSSPYPQVIPCDKVPSVQRKKFPHEGVGISLDKNFSNVMWVAIPGRNLTLFGDLKPQAITNDDLDRHIEKITSLEVFKGVRSKSDLLKPLQYGSDEYLRTIATDTAGTDHAVNWARELHCVKIPAPRSSLDAVTKFLNDSNKTYRTGKEYEWSKLSNNCVHISINQSHAMGINDAIKTDQKFIKKLMNMALPANGFLMYADQTVLAGEPSKRELARALSEKDFYPVQVGSIMEEHKVFPSGEYFNTEDLEVLTAPRILKPWKLLSTPRKYAKKYMTPQNSKLKENAQMWALRYEKLLGKLKSSERGSKLEKYLIKQLHLSQRIIKEE